MGFFSRKKKQDFSDFPPIGGLMVSKMITDEGRKPRFMFREKRSRPEDSGWRIFSAGESDAYTNDPNNFGIYNPSTILQMDSSIADLLLKGVGSVYERKSDKSEWYRVYDYPLEDDYIVSHKLTDRWGLKINNLFERRVEEEGTLQYTTGDKTLRLTIWNYKDTIKDDIYKEHIDKVNNRDETYAKTLEKFDFSDKDIYRIGYRIKESAGDKEYDVIYGFTVADNQVLVAVFYYDEPEDKKWAVQTWKDIVLIN